MNFEEDLSKCLEVLRKGALILYPTDTVWGIGCDATNGKAVEKIYKLKRRSDEKAMIVLVADEKDIMQYVAAPDLSLFEKRADDRASFQYFIQAILHICISYFFIADRVM